MARSVALGFRAHSGWAAVIALSGTARQPEILERRKIDLADSSIPRAEQPYHAAAELPFERGRELLKCCEAASERLAHEALCELLGALKAQGLVVIGCGLVLASGRSLPPLESILASHALIHAAEGEHFRDALAHASERLGLPVVRVPERELRVTSASLQTSVNAAGKQLGLPWTADQKLAALVAWRALAQG